MTKTQLQTVVQLLIEGAVDADDDALAWLWMRAEGCGLPASAVAELHAMVDAENDEIEAAWADDVGA